MLKFISLLVVVVLCSEPSHMKSVENDLAVTEADIITYEITDVPEMSLNEEPTESVTENFENFLPSSSSEISKSDETKPVEIPNGSFFRLKMTILHLKWNDDFMDRTSKTFQKLATNLGAELIDFIDNSQESSEPNVTNFKLVEVLPSKETAENLYVTFIISSKKELSGEDLNNSIVNQINLYGKIYEHEANADGYVLEKISKDEALKYDDAVTRCDSGKVLNFYREQKLKLI